MSLQTYLNDTKAEMKHVVFPTTRHVAVFTALVIVFSLIIAYILGGFDFIFAKGLSQLLVI